MSRWKLGGRVRDDYFFYEVTSLPGLGDAILRYQFVPVNDFWSLR